ncbi:MAG: hypothetical protein KGZ59_08735 [Chitinophagaceae bacterium]|nr:hypothetical protein [Chitinophagaceae bacterium]
MRNKLSVDDNVEQKWKQLNNWLYWGFILIMVIRVFVRLRDRYNFDKSEVGNILLILALVIFLSWGLINVAYRFKPTWFHKKEVE